MNKLNVTRPLVGIVCALTIVMGVSFAFTPSKVEAATPCINRVFQRFQPNDSCIGHIQTLFNASVDRRPLPLNHAFLAVDNSYGPLTTDAIRWFQTRTGLQVDGITGPQTWRQLCFRGGNNGYFTKDVLQYGLNAAVAAGCQAYGVPTSPLPLPL